MNRKIMIYAAIIAAVLLFLFGRSCGIKSVIKNTRIDTVIHRDTVTMTYKIRYDSISYQDKVKYVSRIVYDTLWSKPDAIILPTDTAAIMRDYYAARFYKDTQRLKRGTVIISDTVTENRIVGRRLLVSGVDTTITKTIILKPPRRIVGYWTLSGMGNFRTPFGGTGIGFGLKTPGETVYQAEWKYVNRGETKGRTYGEIRVMIPIRFK